MKTERLYTKGITVVDVFNKNIQCNMKRNSYHLFEENVWVQRMVLFQSPMAT